MNGHMHKEMMLSNLEAPPSLSRQFTFTHWRHTDHHQHHHHHYLQYTGERSKQRRCVGRRDSR
ncbi:hypothetical protein E2C01_002244 [Portunus trituberculatus]|uniref:Uncharacterized protein n=1 Tax=Portunus trituberculatus TaxID=210409 RepID=A0A5B7CJ81_PORTR|nr:hypothetical protein [Portunus trituberculatus]